MVTRSWSRGGYGLQGLAASRFALALAGSINGFSQLTEYLDTAWEECNPFQQKTLLETRIHSQSRDHVLRSLKERSMGSFRS